MCTVLVWALYTVSRNSTLNWRLQTRLKSSARSCAIQTPHSVLYSIEGSHSFPPACLRTILSKPSKCFLFFFTFLRNEKSYESTFYLCNNSQSNFFIPCGIYFLCHAEWHNHNGFQHDGFILFCLYKQCTKDKRTTRKLKFRWLHLWIKYVKASIRVFVSLCV